MMITDFCICAPTLDEAEALAHQHMGKFVESNFHHYEFLGEHFATVKGYDAYAQKAEMARKGGTRGCCRGFYEGRRLGHAGAHPARTGGATRGSRRFRAERIVPLRRHPYPKAETSMRLFAKEVLPVLKRWQPAATATAAE